MQPNRLPSLMLGLSLTFAPYACGEPTSAKPPSPASVDIPGMDRSVAPGTNFFAYANGAWLRTHEIPSDRSSYGSWDVIEELVERRVADLIRQASQGTAADPETRKVGDYFASFMQEDSIEDPRSATAATDPASRCGHFESPRAGGLPGRDVAG